MKAKRHTPILLAVLAAACYGVSTPVAKLLLVELPSVLLAALLYLGAGAGMAIVGLFGRGNSEARLTRAELPYTAAMIALDIAAPILLMLGLTRTTPANASLLNNFEIVATSLVALLVFKEAIGRRMWLALALITLASVILSFEGVSGFSFSLGSVFVLAACLCWGIENNCTRMLSLKNPLQIVVIKGFGSGAGALIVAVATGGVSRNVLYIAAALLLGFLAYGLSIFFYIKAQRELGAARTSAYYAVAPFIGASLSFVFFRQPLTASFGVALAIMVAGAYFAAVEAHAHSHTHEPTTHEHRHSHADGHHAHTHGAEGALLNAADVESEHSDAECEHSHVHSHDGTTHTHRHTPDMHHVHSH